MGGHFFLCFFLCIPVLDNPRTTVYNKVKERRYPCKRLAPHQSSITKVMTATGLGVLGGHFFLCFFLCILVLDNPRTAVYNKDKERRWLHSGQLPLSVSHFEKHDRRSLEDYRGGHFSCHFIF